MLAHPDEPYSAAPGRSRPSAGQRRFYSQAVEDAIHRVTRLIGDPVLADMFANALPRPLDTTVSHYNGPEGARTFVEIGELPAMGLRDATEQLWPYLRFVNDDPGLREIIIGTIRRQTEFVLIDPYANTFNDGATGGRLHPDRTAQSPDVFERKWELASLAQVLRLASGYWRTTGDLGPFDRQWRRMVARVIETLTTEQGFEPARNYRFRRYSDTPEDILGGRGYGPPSKPCGLVRSAFRPSNDACTLPFHIPSNALLVVALRQTAEILAAMEDDDLASDAVELADQVNLALITHALAHPDDAEGTVLAYEVDGYGSQLLMDEANNPNLISLAYYGYCAPDDSVYRATRHRAFSTANPWFVLGDRVAGLGSPHSGLGRVWPASLVMQALTSTHESELLTILQLLVRVQASSGLIQQSVNANDPGHDPGPDQPHGNALFAELILMLADSAPHMLAERLTP